MACFRDALADALCRCAASNLHRAASYARSALGDRGAVVLRGEVVELAPAAEVSTDVERFERGEDSACGRELLPDGGP